MTSTKPTPQKVAAPDTGAAASLHTGTSDPRTLILGNLRQSGIYIALVVIVALFAVLTDGVSLSPGNLTNIVLQYSYILVLAIGMVIVIIGGHIDLSVGSVVALVGGVIYAVGIVIASFTRGSEDLWLLILGYGVISGFGLGVAYIVPIAMLQKWFPDKKGLITGLAVAAGLGIFYAEWVAGVG